MHAIYGQSIPPGLQISEFNDIRISHGEKPSISACWHQQFSSISFTALRLAEIFVGILRGLGERVKARSQEIALNRLTTHS